MLRFLAGDPDDASLRQRRIGALVVLAILTSPAWAPALVYVVLGWPVS